MLWFYLFDLHRHAVYQKIRPPARAEPCFVDEEDAISIQRVRDQAVDIVLVGDASQPDL